MVCFHAGNMAKYKGHWRNSSKVSTYRKHMFLLRWTIDVSGTNTVGCKLKSSMSSLPVCCTLCYSINNTTVFPATMAASMAQILFCTNVILSFFWMWGWNGEETPIARNYSPCSHLRHYDYLQCLGKQSALTLNVSCYSPQII